MAECEFARACRRVSAMGRNADQVDLAGDAGSELGLRWIGDQDNPLTPMHSRMRAFDRDLIRGGIMASGHVNRT